VEVEHREIGKRVAVEVADDHIDGRLLHGQAVAGSEVSLTVADEQGGDRFVERGHRKISSRAARQDAAGDTIGISGQRDRDGVVERAVTVAEQNADAFVELVSGRYVEDIVAIEEANRDTFGRLTDGQESGLGKGAAAVVVVDQYGHAVAELVRGDQ